MARVGCACCTLGTCHWPRSVFVNHWIWNDCGSRLQHRRQYGDRRYVVSTGSCEPEPTWYHHRLSNFVLNQWFDVDDPESQLESDDVLLRRQWIGAWLDRLVLCQPSDDRGSWTSINRARNGSGAACEWNVCAARHDEWRIRPYGDVRRDLNLSIVVCPHRFERPHAGWVPSTTKCNRVYEWADGCLLGGNESLRGWKSHCEQQLLLRGVTPLHGEWQQRCRSCVLRLGGDDGANRGSD